MKAPNSKHQHPEKHQGPISNLNIGHCLMFGISLELGAWNLEFFDLIV
jgi:hypothetical protein